MSVAPFFPKKLCTHKKRFLAVFSKKVAFSKKVITKKIFKSLLPIKNIIFIFVVRRPVLPSKMVVHPPKNSFLQFSQKTWLFFSCFFFFLKKVVNKKIFISLLFIKKVIFIFFVKWLILPKTVVHYPRPSEKSSSRFSQKILLSSKKVVNKNIFSSLLSIKKVIFSFVVRRPIFANKMVVFPPKIAFSRFSQKTLLFFRKSSLKNI